jgi:adenylate cyclase
VRIGINSGPVIAGVVGKKKYAYDLWGDTVNVAARMETSGTPGEIHLSDNTYRLISDKYNFTRREPLKIKGKGLMQTYFLKPD